jgi:glycosyltransferase involved in cell wall biosynthesis
MTQVSVIVPVYNPGSDMDDLIRTLLGQTLPAEELELVFVDDGSTDGTAARLDALAEEHGHVRVQHISNSGWPGRPRNVGLDCAQGDYVFFADNDDWLEPDALERLYATAVTDRADIVIGKVVGHGKRVNRSPFRKNVHGQPFDSIALLGLLTPHKLFRRRFLDEHAIRFPEGKLRLEDHMFVVPAYFRAERISVLADRPVYHWVRRESEANASYERFDAESYFGNVREVLDLVDANTEPGEWREKVKAHWYRGKMLQRVGGRGWLARDAEYREELYAAVRKLALERFDESVHERMAFNLRVRSKLLRAQEAYEPLELLARYETRLRSHVKLRKVTGRGTHVVLKLDAKLGGQLTPLRFEQRADGRILWVPPEKLRPAIAEEDRDVTADLEEDSGVQAFLQNVDDGSQYLLPSRTDVRVRAAKKAGRVRVRLRATVPIAPTAAAAGLPLPPGRWHVKTITSVAGFQQVRRVYLEPKKPLVLTTYDPGRIVVGTKVPPPLGRKAKLRRAVPPWADPVIKRMRGAAGAARRAAPRAGRA